MRSALTGSPLTADDAQAEPEAEPQAEPQAEPEAEPASLTLRKVEGAEGRRRLWRNRSRIRPRHPFGKHDNAQRHVEREAEQGGKDEAPA